MDEDVRIIGKCEECESEVVSDNGDVYVDEDGRYYCCLDCLLEHYHITRLEEY